LKFFASPIRSSVSVCRFCQISIILHSKVIWNDSLIAHSVRIAQAHPVGCSADWGGHSGAWQVRRYSCACTAHPCSRTHYPKWLSCSLHGKGLQRDQSQICKERGVLMSRTHLSRDRRLKNINIVLCLVFGLSFAFIFLIALFGSLTHLPWRKWLPGAENCRSLIGSVQAAVYSFMSYL